MNASCAARISLVETGSRPGSIRGPIEPPSSTIVSAGACSRLARTLASSGAPTPANTTQPSRSSRLPAIVISSTGVASLMSPPRLGSPRSCRHQFARPPALLEQPRRADGVQGAGEAARPVEGLLEVDLHAGHAVAGDHLRVAVEVVEVGLVAAVALVWIGAERHLDHRIHDEAGDHRPVGRADDRLGWDDLLG